MIMLDFKEFTEKKIFDEHVFNHILSLNLLEEDTTSSVERDKVIKLIKDGKWDNNVDHFYEALYKSKHPLMLSKYSKDDLKKMKLFKIDGYDIGFSLKNHENKKFSEIVSVFNNEPNIKNVGSELIKMAVKNGGCYLDHFDGFLDKFYNDLGFEEYDRMKYDDKYDSDGNFAKEYGKKDVIFKIHKSCK